MPEPKPLTLAGFLILLRVHRRIQEEQVLLCYSEPDNLRELHASYEDSLNLLRELVHSEDFLDLTYTSHDVLHAFFLPLYAGRLYYA